jgi:hypothetical protein
MVARKEAEASPEVALAASRQEQLAQAERLLGEAGAQAARAKADVARLLRDGADPGPAERAARQAAADEQTYQARVQALRPLAEAAEKEARAVRQRAPYVGEGHLSRELRKAREAAYPHLYERLGEWLLQAVAVLDVEERQQ